MIAKFESFHVGTLYSNEEIYGSLSTGNAGGIRIRTGASGEVERLAIFTSLPSARQLAENPYHDRIEGDVLTYTGAGRAGDQSVSGSNARILQQREKRFPTYGFQQVAGRRDKKVGNRRWAFLGLLEFMRCCRERQLDTEGAWRNVWVFELRIHPQPSVVEIVSERALTDAIFDRSQTDDPLDDSEVVGAEERAAESSPFDLQVLEPIRKRMLAFDPRQFEHFIKDLLVQSGFVKVDVTKYGQDGGIDINARPGFRSWPLRHLLLQVQAKRWLHTVGRKDVAELRGSLLPHASGCIVTTSHFSRAALKESIEPGKSPIATIDGYELANIIDTLKLKIE